MAHSQRARLFLSLSVLIILVAFSRPQTAAAQPSEGPDILTLADQITAYLHQMKFIEGTTRQGSVTIYDLKTKAEISINPNVRYSGASVTKVKVLIGFLYVGLIYQRGPVTREDAILLAKMMLCSDNAATNALIKKLGDGKIEKGLISLNNIDYDFGEWVDIKRLYRDDGTPEIVSGPVVPADADADVENSFIAGSVGGLVRAIKYCSQRRADDPSSIICLKTLHLMRANQIGALIEGGVPEGTFIAHKQGWTQDTHGDVAYIRTPKAEYVLEIMLHQRKFLQSAGSFPVMAEISRMVYSAYHPDAPLKAIRSTPIPKECVIPEQVIADLLKTDAPPLP